MSGSRYRRQWVRFGLLVQYILSIDGIGSGCALATATTEWKPPFYPMPQNTVHAIDLGVVPDPVNAKTHTDITASLQTALNRLTWGQTLYLAPGIYYVHAPLFIASGVSLQGPQDSRGYPLATIIQAVEFRQGSLPELTLGVLVNANYAASMVIDRNITITAVAFDEQNAGILFRMTRNVRIRGCSFSGGGDGAAFLASQDILVTRSLATNTRNAAYDFWDGVRNGTRS